MHAPYTVAYRASCGYVVNNAHAMVAKPPTVIETLLIKMLLAHCMPDTQPVSTRDTLLTALMIDIRKAPCMGDMPRLSVFCSMYMNGEYNPAEDRHELKQADNFHLYT